MKPDDTRTWWALTQEEAEWIKHMRAAKTCASKVPFDTYEDAIRGAIKASMDVRNTDRKQLYPYECRICKKHHLTSKRPKEYTESNRDE